MCVEKVREEKERERRRGKERERERTCRVGNVLEKKSTDKLRGLRKDKGARGGEAKDRTSNECNPWADIQGL